MIRPISTNKLDIDYLTRHNPKKKNSKNKQKSNKENKISTHLNIYKMNQKILNNVENHLNFKIDFLQYSVLIYEHKEIAMRGQIINILI